MKRGLAVVVVGFPATTVIYSRARLGRYPFVPAHLKSYVVCLSVYIIQILHLRGTHSSRLGVRCEGDRRGGGPAAAQVQPQLHRLRALRHPTLPYHNTCPFQHGSAGNQCCNCEGEVGWPFHDSFLREVHLEISARNLAAWFLVFRIQWWFIMSLVSIVNKSDTKSM